ncbi:MAG: C4-type zinc ribbon domain-containing protein [Planctomycetota bacterium]
MSQPGQDPEIETLGGATLVGLVTLQRLDEELAELEGRRRGKPGELAARRRDLDAQEAACGSLRDLLKSTKKAIDGKNLSAESLEAEITKLEGQLFSLKSNDEFERMKKQIADRKQSLSDHQDKAIELMMALDELGEKLANEIERRDELAEVVKKVEDKIAADLARLETQIAAKRTERDGVAASLPNSLVELYEEVAKRHDGVGAAPLRLEGNTCGGCFTEARTQIVGAVMAGKLTQCPYCDRILYLSRSLEG